MSELKRPLDRYDDETHRRSIIPREKLDDDNSDDEDDDDSQSDNWFTRLKNSIFDGLKNLWQQVGGELNPVYLNRILKNFNNYFCFCFQKFFRISLAVFFLALYFVYFGFAMAIQNPFGFLSEEFNSSANETVNILDDRVFTNNQSLALLVITIIVVLVALWDIVLVDLARKFCTCNLAENSIVSRYGAW